MNFHRIKEILSTHDTLPSHEWKGAVLFLCNEEFVFLIKRSELMPTHSGQIAFVGGHRLPEEDDPWIVAQREFEEETNLNREVIEFLGTLPTVMTARLQMIVPVMAKLQIPTDQFLDEAKSNGEWDDMIAYPWSNLLIEDSWDFAWRHGEVKSPVMFHSIRPRSYLPLASNSKPHILWGATATMIWSFLKLYFK